MKKIYKMTTYNAHVQVEFSPYYVSKYRHALKILFILKDGTTLTACEEIDDYGLIETINTRLKKYPIELFSSDPELNAAQNAELNTILKSYASIYRTDDWAFNKEDKFNCVTSCAKSYDHFFAYNVYNETYAFHFPHLFVLNYLFGTPRQEYKGVIYNYN